MTTDITELAQRMKAAAENAIGAHERLAAYPYGEIIDLSQHEGEQINIDITDINEFHEEANPVNVLALVEALEKAQSINSAAEKLVRCKGRYHSEQNYRALAALFGVTTPDLPPLDSESRTVTDWIEHDGKWRPESLGLDELVYLKTRKQALKIPYPAGKVKGWVHRGCAMDVMAYKLASPQARAVTVKLPEPVGVIGTDHWIGEMNMRSAVIQELKSTGIKWEAE
ncbi:ead/Ea22-like family protein [Raoultella planticola]|uniref:ead/Ea22-like family protein n=1 Tax=Raoultella planticola TaxID=575 RepID=UPI0040683509